LYIIPVICAEQLEPLQFNLAADHHSTGQLPDEEAKSAVGMNEGCGEGLINVNHQPLQLQG